MTIIDLTGAWRLQSWTIEYPDTGRHSKPFGSNPEGIIVYSAAGWMTAAIARGQRDPLPADQALRELPAEQLAEAYTSYFHYAGPYYIKGSTVFHSVAMSLNPNMVGTEQVREIKLQGDSLELRGIESIEGRSRNHSLLWQRITSTP